MAKFWETTNGYIALHEYVGACTRMSFSKMTLEGLEKIPDYDKYAVILAPNHCAAMIDPILVLQVRRHAPVGFGARSDIFANPRTAKILRWLRILPIARERNGTAELMKNYAIFDEAVECMDHGTPFCLFAEGTHRAERGMMPVKKGIFRIAKIAIDKLDKPVCVVPVGIDYEYFFLEHGRVALRIGDPINVSQFFQDHSDMPEGDIYRLLCDELHERDLGLIGRIPEHRHDLKALRLLGAVASLPLFLACSAISIPVWLPATIIMRTFEDKAWTHTVHFVLRFIFPVFWPFQWIAGVLFIFYHDLIKDFKK
ncbi:MAG: 1-acyl-sn-glycerol-3-phosphate acyltransferase [Bacteroidales bacterium]|nr:1-acyl-sn-glycerol-3-phosphate acyltransferase [Bacteroidales bacterium]